MADIQIDMFDVQLGAALLLQFDVGGRLVRVLADAGVKASGYRQDHVLERLLPILRESGNLHIDLVIGTHYDEDHLNGLVPIIRHEEITIGEAWMPPVANDSRPHALDDPLTPVDLLANQLYEDQDGAILADYLRVKRADIETLLVLEGRREVNDDQALGAYRKRLLSAELRDELLGPEYFREHLGQQDGGDACDHAPEVSIEQPPEVEQAIASARRSEWIHELFWDDGAGPVGLDRQLSLALHMGRRSCEARANQVLSFREIRKSTAKDAINAIALASVLAALRDKEIPIRTEIVDDGVPRRYAWREDRERFLPAARDDGEPVLTLLGPSRGLVRKHWNRLPVEQASRVALSFLSPIKSITPSNQLSYVLRLEHREQGVLVSGDAGCVDFKLDRTRYHPKLLAALLPLHVLQVAHHAGNNAHFYRVLNAAGYPEQSDHSFLLLSHATADAHRPSDEFRLFLLATLDRGDDVRLLSTAKPKPEKSRDFAGAFHPPVGPQDDRGDIRLVFENGAWEVKGHAIVP